MICFHSAQTFSKGKNHRTSAAKFSNPLKEVIPTFKPYNDKH